MKRILIVGIEYTGPSIDGVEIENLGLCRSEVSKERSAYCLYDYDTIIINPQSYTHFIFGKEGTHSNSQNELSALKRENNDYDLDTVFDYSDRSNELEAAIDNGATVIWCLAPSKREQFYGYRTTDIAYLNKKISSAIKSGGLVAKRGRTIKRIDPNSPFKEYFESLKTSGWSTCLTEFPDGYETLAETPEGYSLGGRIELPKINGWILTPPTSQESINKLISCSIFDKSEADKASYHGIFLSHTGVDKPFARRLKNDLVNRGVPRVWLDEAEIDIGDSLIRKIEEGMRETKYIGVVLSEKSIKAPWVLRELDIAINREISGGEVAVLPLLYDKCELPTFLQGKLYADFTDTENYEEVIQKLLRRLKINKH